MTPEQEDKLIEHLTDVSRVLHAISVRNRVDIVGLDVSFRSMCRVFGFTRTNIDTGDPVRPPQTRGPTTEHQQAEADADYENKHEAIFNLLNGNIDAFHVSHIAHDIMRLWSELKAIMEPASDICRGCGCKRGQPHTSNYLSAQQTCGDVQAEWDGARSTYSDGSPVR